LGGNFYRLRGKDVKTWSYEVSEEDVRLHATLCEAFKLDEKTFSLERLQSVLNAWENDTGKGEIFPIERALILVKD
jgi:hypothetical protein